MSDPATTEITGPTRLWTRTIRISTTRTCSSDRRHVINVSLVARSPEFTNTTARAILGGWQLSPLVRWQSGNRSSVTTGVDNALTGMGGQRGVQILDDPYGDGTPGNYLNRAAFTTPAAGTYSPLAPFTIVNPSRLQNDLAITRSVKTPPARPSSSAGKSQRDQPRELQRPDDGAEQRQLRQDPECG